MALQVVRSLGEEVWREFVDSHPQGRIFHTPDVFEIFARAKGYRPALWATVDDSGYPLALLLPVYITLAGGLLRYLTTRAVAYSSVLYAPNPDGKEALRLLLEAYRQAEHGCALFTELRHLCDASEIHPLLDLCGFSYEENLNYLIDLDRPVEQIMQSIAPRTRKRIRRGLRTGDVVVEEVTERNQLKICHDLLCDSYAHAGVPVAPLSLFEAAFDALQPRNQVKFWMARVGEACASVSAELLHGRVAYGWYAGTDRRYSSSVPGEMLMWHVLSWCADNGYSLYDFGGAGRPGQKYGVREFKAKFGGQLVNYGRHTLVHAPYRLALSRLAYSLRRALKLRYGLSMEG